MRADGRAVALLAFRQAPVADDFSTLLFVRAVDGPAAVRFDRVDLAVCVKCIGLHDPAQRDAPSHRLARGRIQDLQFGTVVEHPQPIIQQQRLAAPDHQPVDAPCGARLGQVRAHRLFGRRRVDGDEGPHRGALRVLLTVPRIDARSRDQWRRVDAAPREGEFPDRPAGAGLQRPDAAVARAENQRLLAVDHRDRGTAVRRVLRQFVRAGVPDHVARPLVQGEHAVRRLRHLTPAGHDAADDDQVLKYDREVRAAAVGTEQTQPFVQRNVPPRLPGPCIDALEMAAHALGEDAGGLRVARTGRPADARVRDIGQIDIETVLPDRLARLGVEAHDLFTLPRGVGLGQHQRVEFAFHHDGGAAASQIGTLPADITSFATCPVEIVQQARFVRDAVETRSAPEQPVARIGRNAVRVGGRCSTRPPRPQRNAFRSPRVRRPWQPLRPSAGGASRRDGPRWNWAGLHGVDDGGRSTSGDDHQQPQDGAAKFADASDSRNTGKFYGLAAAIVVKPFVFRVKLGKHHDQHAHRAQARWRTPGRIRTHMPGRSGICSWSSCSRASGPHSRM